MPEKFNPEIGYWLRNGLPDDAIDCGHDEERIEEGSDVFFEVLSPLINVQTGKFDPHRFPEYVARYQEALDQLTGYSYAEIDHSEYMGAQLAEDHVQLMRDSAAREQYGS